MERVLEREGNREKGNKGKGEEKDGDIDGGSNGKREERREV